MENELGLIREDRSLKPVIGEFKAFSAFLEKLPFKNLPLRKAEAVCILTEGQDQWAVAYSSFILAKQAGFDFTFQKAGQELKDAPLYLLPSLKGIDPMYKGDWLKLLDRVKAGATLYMSLGDVYLNTFNEPLGIELLTNIKRRGNLQFNYKFLGDSLRFTTSAERKLSINTKAAKVLATEADDSAALIEAEYGKGKIFLLTFPLEANLTATTGAFDKGAPAYAAIYKQVAEEVIAQRVVGQQNPFVGTTEHNISRNEKVVVLINYSAEPAVSTLLLKAEWTFSGMLYGNSPASHSLTIPANDAVVLRITKN